MRVTCLGPVAALAAAEPGPGEAAVELKLEMAPEEVGQDPVAFQVRVYVLYCIVLYYIIIYVCDMAPEEVGQDPVAFQV